jgi:acyl-coenzyme A synthetase/AMP-(fatty) acid ligase
METGGMKGRREELIRDEMHRVLKRSFGVSTIHSEYGMTELLSQAYSRGEGIFNCPPWMKMLVRDDEDPFSVNTQGSGAINIIDLANIYSCSFIATDDVGKIYPDGGFEILGRMDGSDLRGCSLLAL